VTEEEQSFLGEQVMAIKLPRRRIRNEETHNVQDMNDTLLPVVEEMGRLNEHNFNSTMQTELTLTDMSNDVAFNISCPSISWSGSHVVDVSDKGTEANIDVALAAGSLFRIPQDNKWHALWPDKLSRSFISRDGGMFRFLASGQWGSERMTQVPVSSYFRFAFRIDGAVIPDSVIGDQDYFQSNDRMETGLAGQLGAFLLDFTLHLNPGQHTVDVVVQNLFLEAEPRREIGAPTVQNKMDAYCGSAEILIWEMNR